MAEITITVADVSVVQQVDQVSWKANAAVTPGAILYKDVSANDYGLASNDAGTEQATIAGYCLGYASSGEYFPAISAARAATGGILVVCGGTIAAGKVYVLGRTPGKFMLADELTSGELLSIVGVGATTANMELAFNSSGYAVA